MTPSGTKTLQILALLRVQGLLRPKDLRALGIDPSNLAHLHRQGLLERAGRGLYTLTDGDWTEHHSLVEVARRVPGCVIGLASALRFHGLTQEMPHQVWLFISRKARKPHVLYPAISVFRSQPDRLYQGVIRPLLEGTEVCITDVPRTVVDCFIHRRAIGLDVALLAMKESIHRRLCTAAELASTAQRGRVWNLMRPYLEGIL